jgi:hypothetical protein
MMTLPGGAVMFQVQFASSEYTPMTVLVSMMPGLITCPPQPAKAALSIHTRQWIETISKQRRKQSTFNEVLWVNSRVNVLKYTDVSRNTMPSSSGCKAVTGGWLSCGSLFIPDPGVGVELSVSQSSERCC